MRITEIHIKGEYKNLKDFKVSFDGASFLEIFVGKNGTGKSNFFEAVLIIFKHLFEEHSSISFNYSITYELNGDSVFVEWQDIEWIDKDGNSFTPDKTKMPENILVYYSGHNKTIGNLLEESEKKHKDTLNTKRDHADLLKEVTRRFMAIDKQYKSILISILLLQEESNKAKTFIEDKLGVASIGDEITIVFKRPEYASDKAKFIFEEHDDEKRFWSPKGYFKKLLDEIWEVGKAISFVGVRDEGKIDDDYILIRSFSKFQDVFHDYSPLELFIAFDNLKTIGYLKEISIEVTLITGKTISIDQFSDGQFQSIYIYAITELFKDKNCITLLDEPDSFLHPEWQHQFLNQVYKISDESAKTNHVLMSSHSAVTLIPFEKERIKFFDFKEDGSINNYPLPKRVAIEKLSDSLIGYTEQEQILSIVNTIQIENKPVLFTEGKTDPLIIKEAWNKLYPGDKIPFIPFYAFGHKFVSQIMKDPEVIEEMNGLPIFGLFDYDKAFNTWNGFSTEDECTDIGKGLVKKMTGNNVYAMMLPVPLDKPIKTQVVNPRTGETFGENSLMAIEHLFCHIGEVEDKFVIDIKRTDGFKKFHGDKVRFAKIFVPSFEREHFEVFIPMFEFIKSKIE